MMDKKPHIKPYVYAMLAGFGAITLSIAFFFFLYRFDSLGSAISTLTDILMPFIYGGVIAYLLKPVCNIVEDFLRRFIPEKYNGLINALSIIATMLFGLLIVYALVMMIVPQLISSITSLYYTMQQKLPQFVAWVNDQSALVNNELVMDTVNKAYQAITVDLDKWVKSTLIPSMQNIVSGVGIGVLNVVTVLKNLLIGVIVAIYLLASRKRFAKQGELIVYSVFKPRWATLIIDELKYADKTFGGFINGKIVDSAIIGVLCYICCVLFRFPSALLVSVIVGVTNVIPFFGPFIGAIPSALLILIQDPIKAIWFLLFILVLQQLDGNVIGPAILGDSTGLSSFWVLFSILLFGGLWGFVGMIVGVPLWAVIYDVVKKLVFHGLRRNNELDKLASYHEQFGDPEDPSAVAPAQPEPPAQK